MDTNRRHGILGRVAAVHSQPQLPDSTTQQERRAVMVRQAGHVASPRRGQQERVRPAKIPCGRKPSTGELAKG